MIFVVLFLCTACVCFCSKMLKSFIRVLYQIYFYFVSDMLGVTVQKNTTKTVMKLAKVNTGTGLIIQRLLVRSQATCCFA